MLIPLSSRIHIITNLHKSAGWSVGTNGQRS